MIETALSILRADRNILSFPVISSQTMWQLLLDFYIRSLIDMRIDAYANIWIILDDDLSQFLTGIITQLKPKFNQSAPFYGKFRKLIRLGPQKLKLCHQKYFSSIGLLVNKL